MSKLADPLVDDLWIASLMGPYHLFPAGHDKALCGREWISQAWGGRRDQPSLGVCCQKCVELKGTL